MEGKGGSGRGGRWRWEAAAGPQWPGRERGTAPGAAEPSRAAVVGPLQHRRSSGLGRRFPARSGGWYSVSCVGECGGGWRLFEGGVCVKIYLFSFRVRQMLVGDLFS